MKNPDNPTPEDIKNAFIKVVSSARNLRNVLSKYEAEYENACDYLYYGYGFNKWYKAQINNGSEMSEEEAKTVWNKAFHKMANED
jgi:hypothetical protein